MPNLEMLDKRLGFLNIDRDVISEIRNARDILEPMMDEMLDRFYSHVLGEPELRALFVDQDAVRRARSAQKNHWLKTLFDGRYDNAYFERTAEIGRAHARVGLTPNWYIGGYCHMLDQFIELISSSYSDGGKPAAQMIQAVAKVIFLDMDMVIHCYVDAKDSSMRQILRRATDFATDAAALNDELGATARQIKATAEEFAAQTAGQTGATSSRTEVLSEQTEPIDELLARAEQLLDQTARLDERLKGLQFRDKLYIADGTPGGGTLSRLKALLLGRRQSH